MPVALGTALAVEVLGAEIAGLTIAGNLTVGAVVGYGITSASTFGASFTLAPRDLA